MPTTTYVEFTASARAIGARTDSAGAAATDITAEEDRLIQSIITEGYVTSGAFQVWDDSGMNVTVGSGSAKADLYAVAGEIAGQGVYLARLDQTPVTVTIAAAEASQVRNDEIYLVIADIAYDAGSRSLPRIGYRKGDAGGALPGPDAAWKASALLATVNVPAAASSIDLGDIFDERVQATTVLPGPNMATEAYVDNAVATTQIGRLLDHNSDWGTVNLPGDITNADVAYTVPTNTTVVAHWSFWYEKTGPGDLDVKIKEDGVSKGTNFNYPSLDGFKGMIVGTTEWVSSGTHVARIFATLGNNTATIKNYSLTVFQHP